MPHPHPSTTAHPDHPALDSSSISFLLRPLLAMLPHNLVPSEFVSPAGVALRSDRAHDGGPAGMSNGESLLTLSGQRTVWGLPRAWFEGPSGQEPTSADINPGTAPTGESSTESQERFWAESLPLSQHTELPGQSSSAPTLSYALRGLAPHDSP